MQRDESARSTPTTASRTGESPGVIVVTDATLATLVDIGSALTPIVGPYGVVALYQRSLYLCALRHNCLAELAGSAGKQSGALDLAPLRTALAQQDLDTVTQCSSDLLHSLNQLLISLIGAPLAERLLRRVWENSLCGLHPPDTLR